LDIYLISLQVGIFDQHSVSIISKEKSHRALILERLLTVTEHIQEQIQEQNRYKNKEKLKKEPSENRLRINSLGRRKRLFWGSNIVGLSRFIVAMNGVGSHIEGMKWIRRINKLLQKEEEDEGRQRLWDCSVLNLNLPSCQKGYEKKLWGLVNQKKCGFKGCTSRWGFHQTLHAQ